MNDKNFYFAAFFLCLFLAYFFGFRSKQSTGLMNINSILADIGSGSFLGMLFGWIMAIFWNLMLICAYVGMIYSGYKIFAIYSVGELLPVTEKPKITTPNLNSKSVINAPEKDTAPINDATSDVLLKP